MQHTVITSWVENMQFDAVVSNHHLIMDASPEVGGQNKGPKPKELMLASLAGCTGMDVISMLRKMRVNVEKFEIAVEAALTEEHPKHYTGMHVIYSFTGKELDPEKLKKAVELSQDRYCGVSAVYRKTMEVTYEIKISDV